MPQDEIERTTHIALGPCTACRHSTGSCKSRPIVESRCESARTNSLHLGCSFPLLSPRSHSGDAGQAPLIVEESGVKPTRGTDLDRSITHAP